MSNQQWTPGQEWQRPQDLAGQPPEGAPPPQPQQDEPWPVLPQPWEDAPHARETWAPTPPPSKPSPFDFSFTALSLPGSARLIFLLGTAGLVVEWLFAVIRVFATGSEYILVSPLAVLQAVVGGAGALLVKVLALRVLIEIGVAVTTLLTSQKNGSSES